MIRDYFLSQKLEPIKTLGDRAFVHAAPSIWNMLPYGIRNSKTIDCFKSQLKTFLFKKAFDSNF